MKLSNIAIILLALLCVGLSFVVATQLPCNCPPEQPGFGTATISYLEDENDSLRKNNRQLDKQLIRFRSQADSLRQSLIITKHTIQELKQQQHENLSRLDSLNSLELYGFFSKFNP